MSSEIFGKSSALIERSFTGVLGTVDENGIPQLKAMIKTAASGLKEFWFCSNTSSKKVAQIQKNPMPASISLMKKPLRA